MITKAMLKSLTAAATRNRANICPIKGVHAAAEGALIEAMDRVGFIAWDGEPYKSVPRINDHGREALRR